MKIYTLMIHPLTGRLITIEFPGRVGEEYYEKLQREYDDAEFRRFLHSLPRGEDND